MPAVATAHTGSDARGFLTREEAQSLIERVRRQSEVGPVTRYLREVAGLVPDAMRVESFTFRGTITQAAAITNPDVQPVSADYLFVFQKLRAILAFANVAADDFVDIHRVEFNVSEDTSRTNLFASNHVMAEFMTPVGGYIGDLDYPRGGYVFSARKNIRVVFTRTANLANAGARLGLVKMTGDLVRSTGGSGVG